MREKLNENPMMQVALIGVLLVAAAVFLLGKAGGGEEEGEEAAGGAAAAAVASAEAELEAGTQPATLPLPGSGPGALPAPPEAVVSAFDAGQTVAILFVSDEGIDDRLVTPAVRQLEAMSGVAVFVVPVRDLVRYVTIAQGVDLNRVPALVVVRPKNIDRGIPSASVQYGFHSPDSIVQAVVDADYRGRTLPYHP